METKDEVKKMNTQEVANIWLEMCDQGRFMECVEALYADNIISREMAGTPGEIISGKQDVIEKSKAWLDSVQEFHGGDITKPVIAQNHFSSKMSFDVTFKEGGRQHMEEVGVFEVKEGKIINEQFFYSV